MHSLKTRLVPLLANRTSHSAGVCTVLPRQSRCFFCSKVIGPLSNSSSDRLLAKISISPLVGHRRRLLSISRKNYQAKTTETFLLHDIGEGIKEVVVKSWTVKVGDHVNEFDALCEVESDKATAEITSRYMGKVSKIYHEVGATAQVGTPLVDIELDAGSGENKQAQEQKSESIGTSKTENVSRQEPRRDSNSVGASNNVATLPSVRRLAVDHGVDLTKVKATGKHGRILKEDVLLYLSQNDSAPFQISAARPSVASAAPLAQEQAVNLTTIQRAMHKTMTNSLEIPHFNYSDEIDVTRLLEMVQRQKRKLARTEKAASAVPSPFAYMIKMVSMALLDYPQLNASLSGDGTQLVMKHYHNIGVAVDTRHGLIVPNIKNVQSLSVDQINWELLRLRELAYNSKLSTGDLAGGTISLSNIGAIGGTFGVPVIVSPEILIAALGRARRLPRFVSADSDTIEARQVMQWVWSADHRVVDGATLSRFSNLIKQFLEEPETALALMR